MSPLFSLVTKTRPATGGGMEAVVGAVELPESGERRLRRGTPEPERHNHKKCSLLHAHVRLPDKTSYVKPE